MPNPQKSLSFSFQKLFQFQKSNDARECREFVGERREFESWWFGRQPLKPSGPDMRVGRSHICPNYLKCGCLVENMCRTGDCFHILVHFIESLLLDSTKNVAF
jgi:hypothetical protein